MSSPITGLPIPARERYVSRQELAELMSVSVSSVDRMVADGLPSVTWGLRTRRFLPSVAFAWATARSANSAMIRPDNATQEG